MKSKILGIKRTIALMLSVVMILSLAGLFTGCGEKDGVQEENLTESVKVATLNGPTGMGMVKLMDMKDKYEITSFQSPTDINGKLISGEVDVAAVPSNLAAVLYNKTEGNIQAISPITLGVLYILGNDADVKQVSDLKGKTIVASGKGGTPEFVLQKILENSGLKINEDVKIQWLANHTEVNGKLLSEEGTIAMIPEPFVSVAMAANNPKVSVIFDVNTLWKEATNEELPMGVLVARKEFAEERESDLKIFLKDYEKSVNFVNNNPEEAAPLIVEHGFIGKEEIAKAAIPNCKIVLYGSSEENMEKGQKILETFYNTLFEMNPKSIGGKLPGNDLYYGKQ